MAVSVDFNQPQDTPLFKKYAVMNSGLVEAQRYNDSIIASFGLIKVSQDLEKVHWQDISSPHVYE